MQLTTIGPGPGTAPMEVGRAGPRRPLRTQPAAVGERTAEGAGSVHLVSDDFQATFEEYRSLVSVLQRLLDPVLIVSVLFGLEVHASGTLGRAHMILGFLAALVALWSFEAVGLYRSYRSERLWAELPRILLGWACAVGMLLFIGFLSKATALFSRALLSTWVVAVPVSLSATHVLLRLVLRHLRSRGLDTRTAVIVGGGRMAVRLAEQVLQSPSWGIRLLGAFAEGKVPASMRAARLGGLDDVSAYVSRRRVGLVFLALPSVQATRTQELTTQLRDTAASVHVVPDAPLFAVTRVRVQNVGGVPTFAICESPFADLRFRILKRASDIVLASVCLLLAALPMALIALVVRLTSRGPVIFRQRRYGLGGEEFIVYKFRTMRVAEDGQRIEQARRADPRVTRVGAMLRRLSLDELPQLVNVLQGRMSIVGPRPHAVAHNELYRKLIDSYMVRHIVKPGMTGWAQVNGLRGETDTVDKMRRRVEFDLEYINDWSLWLDLRIVLRTVSVLFGDARAY